MTRIENIPAARDTLMAKDKTKIRETGLIMLGALKYVVKISSLGLK
jgi:hypothetical protein